MKCPKCRFENEEGSKFCLECGDGLELKCHQCGKILPLLAKFCNECGERLERVAETEKAVPEAEGERKHVTVLFSDISGYTAMSEKLDPEELKEIMSRIFGEIAQVVTKYEGFIERFVGDAVMAIFGVPKSHEDDPVRGIKAAMEIYELVERISPQLEERVGRPLSMHSGVNTGLVVTGEVNLEQGTHGLTGDTINTTSRLQGLAKRGEILVGQDTYRQTEGHFYFEELEATKVKGKEKPVSIYRVVSSKDKPVTVHRLSGVRADLIGRKAEMAEFEEALRRLHEGRGHIFSICGDAGTGKSRLVEEFKATLDLEEIQWIEGHAYAYSQNIPYFPLIDLLNRIFHMEEDDSPDTIRMKIESGVANLIDQKENVAPFLGSLYSLSYPEIERASPEYWKSQIHERAKMIISALARRAPTIFLLEDLHWADPSFVELLRHTLMEVKQPAIVLCVYRPVFSLFTTHQQRSIGNSYREIRLQDLSASEAQDMLGSLLKTEDIPSELRRFVQDKAEGNPFYLEELINSLIETETISRDNGSWKSAKSISESEISSTIHGVISGRIDRLEKGSKRILQEASVIGRSFFYDILKRITELKHHCDACLSNLQQLDLIRTRSLQPDIEYIFKHGLAQEVVYNGLLKKERKEIHERIGQVMEQLFHNRLPEFYETLAYHFTQGESNVKAVEYLVKSGEKSLSRYAVEEAHQYFKGAFELLTAKTEKSKQEKVALIDIINSWGYVYYYMGDYREHVHLLSSHQEMAESLNDTTRLGMFYAWYGIALFVFGKTKDAYHYLLKAFELGEECGDQKVIGYACTWLSWTCAELALFADGIGYGERAQRIAESYPSDLYLFFKSLSGICFVNYLKGDAKKVFEGAKLLIDHGERTANSRSKCMGFWMNAFGHMVTGDMAASKSNSEKAIEVALDPAYPWFAKTTLIMANVLGGMWDEAEDLLNSAIDFCEKHGFGQAGLYSYLFLAPVLMTKGNMKQGLEVLEEARQTANENGRRHVYGMIEYMFGYIFAKICTGPSPDLSTMARNIGFLVKSVPFAAKRAEEHFDQAIDVFRDIGASSFLGVTLLELGLLHKAKKRIERARDCVLEAADLFDICGADIFLKQAKEVLQSLGEEWRH